MATNGWNSYCRTNDDLTPATSNDAAARTNRLQRKKGNDMSKTVFWWSIVIVILAFGAGFAERALSGPAIILLPPSEMAQVIGGTYANPCNQGPKTVDCDNEGLCSDEEFQWQIPCLTAGPCGHCDGTGVATWCDAIRPLTVTDCVMDVNEGGCGNAWFSDCTWVVDGCYCDGGEPMGWQCDQSHVVSYSTDCDAVW